MDLCHGNDRIESIPIAFDTQRWHLRSPVREQSCDRCRCVVDAPESRFGERSGFCDLHHVGVESDSERECGVPGDRAEAGIRYHADHPRGNRRVVSGRSCCEFWLSGNAEDACQNIRCSRRDQSEGSVCAYEAVGDVMSHAISAQCKDDIDSVLGTGSGLASGLECRDRPAC